MIYKIKFGGHTRLVPFVSVLLMAAFGGLKSSAVEDVLTYHNDTSRSGLYSQETILNLNNVSSQSFGLLYSDAVDGKVDAEPLYASQQAIQGKGTHNVLYVVTENDSVYAFDADNGASLWHISVLAAGETPSDDRGCNQITPQIGITSTPVIDRTAGANGTIFVVAMSKDSSGAYHQRIHALDLSSGAELLNGPVTVSATYPGAGPGGSNGVVSFDPGQYAERCGLLLSNGIIYTSWTSHCDDSPYTGWMIGYSESNLAQVKLINIDPNGSPTSGFLDDGSGNSFWMSGSGPAADSAGNIYAISANGPFDPTLTSAGFPANGDYGDSVIKFSPASGFTVADYFTPYNQQNDADGDLDFGSGGVLLLPDMVDATGITRHLAVGAGKDTNLYVINRDDMGKYDSTGDQIYQEIDGALPGGVWSTSAYFNGNVYYGPQGSNLRCFTFTNARLGTTPTSMSPTTFVYPGSTPSVSSNGTTNGIVWAYDNGGSNGAAILHAYDATNLGNEIYNSTQAPNSRDAFGTGNKFITPMIANGKVYAATTNSVGVFGPILASAASVLTHGSAGSFGLPLSLSGTPTTETRLGSPQGSYSIAITFNEPVTALTATLGLQAGQTGTVVGRALPVSITAPSSTVTVNLTGVGDAQRLNLQVSGITPGGYTVNIPINILWGDVNGDGRVNILDLQAVRLHSGQLVNSQTFQYDLNSDGAINIIDLILDRARSGTALP